MNKNETNRFILIKYIHYHESSNNDSYFPLGEDGSFIFYETNINPDYIIEITKPTLMNIPTKGYYSSYINQREKEVFKIYLSDNRTIWMLSDQYEKFKNIIKND